MSMRMLHRTSGNRPTRPPPELAPPMRHFTAPCANPPPGANPPPVQFQRDGFFYCDECKHRGKGEVPIKGVRYRCDYCADYDLCHQCMNLLDSSATASLATHPPNRCNHNFTRIAAPSTDADYDDGA